MDLKFRDGVILSIGCFGYRSTVRLASEKYDDSVSPTHRVLQKLYHCTEIVISTRGNETPRLISNHIYSKVRDKITYPFSIFNVTAVVAMGMGHDISSDTL